MITHYYPKTPSITSSMAMPRDPLKSTLSPGFRLYFRDRIKKEIASKKTAAWSGSCEPGQCRPGPWAP